MVYRHTKLLSILTAIVLSVILSACGQTGTVTSVSSAPEDAVIAPVAEEIPEPEVPPSLAPRPLLILALDTGLQQVILRDMESTRQFLYTYSFATDFMDKNGQFVGVTQFLPGRVVIVDEVDENGYMSAIRLSDITWEYSGITNYTIDTERGIFSIGDNNYRLRDDTLVFSNLDLAAITDIGKTDTLRVTGNERDVWAITVTSGHGTLSIINTSVFKDSLICIGNIYTLIKGDMLLEIPEGTYRLTVANNGYGGSAEISVRRGEITTIDLDLLKGEGNRVCTLTLQTTVPGAKIRIDGNEISADTPTPVEYGRHMLSVEAEGYESWNKILFVNSPTATIVLEMTREGVISTAGPSGSDDDEEDDKDKDKDKSEETEGSSDSESTEDKEKERQQAELDYLTTISGMVTNLFSD